MTDRSTLLTRMVWPAARALLGGFAALWCIFLIAPIFVVVVAAFTAGEYLVFPPQDYSVRWFLALTKLSWFKTSLLTSLLISTVSTGISILAGVLIARVLARYRPRGHGAIEFIALSPLILPAVVLGFALFSVINSFQLESYAFANLIAGHVLVTIPFIVRSVWSSMAGTDISLEEAAQSMGARPFVVMRKVVLPLARPGILAGAVLAFTYSFNDVSVSIFLASPSTRLLATELMSNIEYSADPTPAAVSTVMVVGAILVFGLIGRVAGTKIFVNS